MMDALMGANRDGGTTAKQHKYSDPEVCREFLEGGCKCELFAGY